MEVSMHLNHSLLRRVQKHKPFSNNPNHKISCELALQNERAKANFYQILSLNSENAGFAEIKKAYKTMALQYHPDVCIAPLTKEESTSRFIELRRAYEVLSDPKTRSIYDLELGLEDPFVACFGPSLAEKTREGDFPREVWERQLNGLRRRCSERMKKRRSHQEST